MKNTCKKAAVYFLCLILLLSGHFGELGSVLAVKGASLPISRIDADQLLDARYRWQAKFRKGKTTAAQLHCDNIYQEQFLKGPRGDWGSQATVGVASLPVGDKTFTEEEAPGCYYADVGEITLEDGTVRTMDLQILVVASYGGKNRYDYRTPSLTTTNPQVQPTGSSLSNITYSWEREMGRPCVSFLKNSIGLRVYCVDGVDVSLTYLDHQTGKPLPVSGHGTLSDIDGLQSVKFPQDCQIRQVYLLKDSEGHLEIQDNEILSQTTSLPSESRKGDITYLFENTSSVKIHFSYKNSLESMTANYEKSLAQAGSKEKLAEKMKKAYYGGNGETLMPHYQGEEWVTSHATFTYTSKVVGRFVEEPSQELGKKVGAPGCTWEEAQVTSQEEPYGVEGYQSFDYLIRYSLSPMALTSFVLEDVLKEGFTVEGSHNVSIYEKNGKEVTGLFDITIANGREIRCEAKKNAMEETTFSENQVYTFRFRVHRREGAQMVFLEDNYTFLAPNEATLRMRYESPTGTTEEQTLRSNQVWVQGRITPSLMVEKRASRYEWRVGELIDYTVKVTQTKQGAWAQNLVITDTDIPGELKLQDGFTVEEGRPEEHFVIAREGENGWKCTGPLLNYDESVVIHFQCLATEASNGREWQNYVYAQSENYVDEVTGETLPPAFAREEVWVNSPGVSVEKEASHFEWKVGELVDYTVTVSNGQPGTLAREVLISDDNLPAGLTLATGAQDIVIQGLPQEVGLPTRDEKTGMNLEHREVVTAEVESDAGGWRIRLNYLWGPAVVQIHFQCLVTGDGTGTTPEEMQSPANGGRPCNQVTVTWKESEEPVEDEEEIYVNTACLFVDKRADHYEWQVGEQVSYQVVVENQYPGTIARNLVIKDVELPRGLLLGEGEDCVTVSGIPSVITQPVKGQNPGETQEKTVTYDLSRGENGWQLLLSDLPSGMPVAINFLCLATEEANGQEAVNQAQVGADNGELRQDEARVYINTAILTLEKQVHNLYVEGEEQEKKDGRRMEEFRVGEEVLYEITVENIQPGSIARELVIEDTKLPSYLQLCDVEHIQVEGVPVSIQEPAEVTEDIPNELNPQYYQETREKEVSATLEGAGSGFRLCISDLPSEMPVRILYRCRITEEANGKEIINQAKAYARNGKEVQAQKKIWVNTPQLVITKQADKEQYQVGDTQTYRIEARQTVPGCVARSVILEDQILTQGAKLSKSTVVLLDEDHQVFQGEVAVSDNAFAAATGRNLVTEGQYWIWDGSEGAEYPQEAWNPLGESRERSLGVEYALEVIDVDLAGGIVENQARVNSMEGYPQETGIQVPVLSPELRVTKESDKAEYHVGDVVYYHLRIEQLREQATARQVQIWDICGEPGMELVPEEILVAKNGKRLEEAVIQQQEQGFSIETKEDLGDKDVMDVYYQMIAKSPDLAGKSVLNTASAKGSNTPESADGATILVEDIRPVLEIQKSSDEKQYRPGDVGAYQVKVIQVRADATARNVVLKDELLAEEARILPETLVVKNKNGAILSDVEIQYLYGLDGEDVTGYVIYTGRDLAEQEFFTVDYEVSFGGEQVQREILNVARATADNLAPEEEPEPEMALVGEGILAKKTSDASSGTQVKKGEKITYYITIENTSREEAKSLLIKDRIPEHTRLTATGLLEDSREGRGQQRTLRGLPYITFYISSLGPGETCTRGFQVEVEEVEELDTIVNTAQVRVTRAKEQDVTEDAYLSGDFRYTNETIHFVGALWVNTLHRVDILPEGVNETLTPPPGNSPEETKKPAASQAPEEPTKKAGEGTGQSSLTPGRGTSFGSSYGSSALKGNSGVDTGDETPVKGYLFAAFSCLLLIVGLSLGRKRLQ